MSVSNHSFICFFFDQTQPYCKRALNGQRNMGAAPIGNVKYIGLHLGTQSLEK
jgi:hypothetical protein